MSVPGWKGAPTPPLGEGQTVVCYDLRMAAGDMVGKKKECFGVQRAAFNKSVMRRSYRRWCMYLKINVMAQA